MKTVFENKGNVIEYPNIVMKDIHPAYTRLIVQDSDRLKTGEDDFPIYEFEANDAGVKTYGKAISDIIQAYQDLTPLERGQNAGSFYQLRTIVENGDLDAAVTLLSVTEAPYIDPALVTILVGANQQINEQN